MKINGTKSKQVVFITYSFGFPNGMASTQRARLLARGLVENGINVTFLCVKALERQPAENLNAKGIYEGIYFEYTPGVTVRSESFIKRRWLELRGLMVAINRLITLKAKDEIYCIYLFGNEKLTMTGCIYRIIAVLLRIPLLLELNEMPWSLKPNPTYWEKKISPIAGASGAIVISDFLYHWVLNESGRISKKVSMLYIPTMMDPGEREKGSSQISQDTPRVLFAGSPIYSETIRFIIKSMDFVINEYPRCQLIITGCKKTDPHGAWMQSEKIGLTLQDNIIFAGYVPRNELLILYKGSNALLIPLFDDFISKARFPIKIGEYLLSGRPVVTTNVGEVTKYFKNNENAFICEPGDPKTFAELILTALRDPDRANEIGRMGRATAIQNFDYSIRGKEFTQFVMVLE
jgi:glycosyltransferase involved in cell wall biosynthesis